MSWPKLKAHVEALSPEYAPGRQANPFVGRWIANVSKSKRHPGNLFQSANVEFEVLGDTVTITDVFVDDLGHEVHGKNTILADGNEHPAGNGYALTARWRGPNILETTAKKDGQVAAWGRYQLSDDGQTLTISGDEQVIVLDRN